MGQWKMLGHLGTCKLLKALPLLYREELTGNESAYGLNISLKVGVVHEYQPETTRLVLCSRVSLWCCRSSSSQACCILRLVWEFCHNQRCWMGTCSTWVCASCGGGWQRVALADTWLGDVMGKAQPWFCRVKLFLAGLTVVFERVSERWWGLLDSVHSVLYSS